MQVQVTKWIIRALVILGLIIVAMLITGSVLPEKHMASVSRDFQSSREEVWVVLTDFQNWHTWRSDLQGLETTGSNTFKEVSKDGEGVDYRIEEMNSPERLVTRIITPDLPYGGSWTYELEPMSTGCRLTITENGEVYNPLFRFMSKYMFGHTYTLETYMNDLSKKVK